MNSITKPVINVSFYNTVIDGQKFENHVTLALLLDSEGNDVTGLDELPQVGTSVKTLGFTLKSGETIFYETSIKANVRSLSPGLRKWASKSIGFMKKLSSLYSLFVQAKSAFKDENEPIHVAIKEFNKELIATSPVLQAIELTEENEMYKTIDIIGKIIINGQVHLLMRIKIKDFWVLFFDITKNMSV